ncbi:MAG TPA: SGNH/GDSL hydrolase family protein, partial [Blastocatellia bacterium]|nr:SGNH/GDSL hydrolase family protein [Blastocatellia bacterium]
ESTFASYKAINRGFGGSEIKDSTYFANQIVFPYKPRMIVLYAGDNDIASGKTAKQVFDDYRAFVESVRKKLPQTRIAFISIKPSPSRWHLVESVKEANKMIREYSAGNKGLSYIDVFTPMLGVDGKPQPDLFVKDNLHMNEKGYAIWKSVIEPYLK